MTDSTRPGARTFGRRITSTSAIAVAAGVAALVGASTIGRASNPTEAAMQGAPAALDARVSRFLEERKDTWSDLNVPYVDGQTLHDLIVKHRFTRALEIGTSTGHSAIWIAWALSKTGGRLTTIEIDPGRHARAVANFKEAGVAPYIDARLGDAHELTKSLAGPWDFVFSDADKEWYPNYLAAVWPKVVAGGCFTAHNVTMRAAGIREFLSALEKLPDGATTFNRSSSAGLSITCKAPDRRRGSG